MKTVVVIPTRNEARYIKSVVEPLIKQGFTVVVSDDHSLDDTADIASSVGATIVKKGQKGKGYGGTLKAGINTAIKAYDADIVVFMDGDGQHRPKDITRMLYPILRDKADVALGNRFGRPSKRPLHRKLGIKFCTWVANINSKQKVSDVSTGYWAIRTTCLPEYTEMGWGTTFELLMKLRADGKRIVEVPVRALWHKHSKDNSTANVFILGVIVLWKIIKWRFICEVLEK